MRFLELSINDFRNISSAHVLSDAEDIVLTGINGQGKTNLLEAIYTLCYGNSFRTPSLKDCVTHQKNGFILKGVFLNEYGEKDNIIVSFQDNKRKILIKEC